MDRPSTDWKALVANRSASGVGTLVALACVPILYASLASASPAVALITSSLSGLLATMLAATYAWPMERKITWQRQLEVFSYRLGVGLVVYAILGFALLFAVNQFSPRQVPLEWPVGYRRRLPFWPFYVLTVLSCWTPLPTPPGAC